MKNSYRRRRQQVIKQYIVLALIAAAAIIIAVIAAKAGGKKEKESAAAAYNSEITTSTGANGKDRSQGTVPAASSGNAGETSQTAETPAASWSETSAETPEESWSQPVYEPTEEPTPEPLPEVYLELDEGALYSDYALFIRKEDQKVLFDRNGYAAMYPASMTKIMTAIVVLENLPDLDMRVDVWQEDSDMWFTHDASVAGFAPGENVSVRDLLYGVMLPSGADACEALARAVAGNEENFVQLMNEKCMELGMVNTHFTNCTGLHNENHYSTCYDMLLLLSYALENESFRIISSTPEWYCESTDAHPDCLYLASTLSGIEGLWLDNGAEIIGGKTGTEDEAGRCLASYGYYGNHEYLLVTGHAPSGETGNLWDAMTIFGSLR